MQSFLFLFAAGIGACGDGPAGLDGGTEPPDAAPDAPAPVDAPATDDPHRTLFVGNSYVYVNDVSGRYRALVEPLVSSAQIEEVTAGGYRLEQHAVDAATDGTELARWLRTGTAEETAFDFVILQEQSQIGAFPETAPDRIASLEAASDLSALARERGASVVLYLTWGRLRGDDIEPELFGTFEAMQDRLDAGYLALADRLVREGVAVRIAPVGGGFRLVYEDAIAAGLDPLAAESELVSLFEPDGSHPSARGAYLAACILAGTTTGVDARSFGDDGALGPAISARLRDVCARALADPRWELATALASDATLASSPVMAGHFGIAVELSDDGTRALVGDPGASRAIVFAETASGWSEEAVLEAPFYGFGLEVALSGDGTRALVAAPHAEVDGVTGVGVVRVFVRRGSSWTEEASLHPPSPLGAIATFGAALALDAGGTRAFVGVPGDVGAAEAAGSVRVFVRAGSAWTEEAAYIADDGAVGDSLGSAIACDAEGTRLIAGMPRDLIGGTGESRVLVRSAGRWMLEASVERGGGGPDAFGDSVAMSGDGSLVLVGAPGAEQAIAFTRAGDEWRRGSVLMLPGGASGDHAGAAVALSREGGRAIVGAPRANTATGSASGRARLFELRAGVVEEAIALFPRDAVPGARLGGAVALDASGSRAIVGAWGVSAGEVKQAGAAYVFALP